MKKENTPQEERKVMQTIKDAIIEAGGSTAYSNERNRPYDGQPHTADGTRGQTLVSGLTFRDVRDCIVKGFLLCTAIDQPVLYERVENNSWLLDDIYKIDFSKVDPVAGLQNTMCEIEKMMGIYPNAPNLTK